VIGGLRPQLPWPPPVRCWPLSTRQWSGRSAEHPLAARCWPTDIRSPLPSEVDSPSVPNVSSKRKDQQKHLPTELTGLDREDDRRIIRGNIDMLQPGARRRDCPREYG
jgi:hypothetical protein